jgi:maltose alpha-D-glucosyltransferase/alpha-amylase
MQWSGDRNAGFSGADPQQLYLPPIADPLYGFQAVNVEAQERSASSLLNWQRRMIAIRGRRPALGRGDMVMLHPANRSVLAILRLHGEEITLVVANLSRFVQPVELDLHEFAGRLPVEVIGQTPFPTIDDHPNVLTLGPHAFYWLDLLPQDATEYPSLADEPELAVSGDWNALFRGESLESLERERLPEFIARQRWFGGKEQGIDGARLNSLVPIERGV